MQKIFSCKVGINVHNIYKEWPNLNKFTFSVSFSCFVHPPALNVLNCTKIPKQLHHRCFKPRHNIITATVFNKGQKCVRNTETVAAIKRSATQQLNRKLRHRRDAFGDTQ